MRSKWRKVGQDSVRKLLLEPGILSVDMITPDNTCEILWQSLCLKYSTDGYTHAPALPHLGVWRLVPSGLQRPLLRYHEWNEITRCGNSAWGVRIWEGFVFCLSRVLCHLPSYFSLSLSPFQVSSHVCLWVLISLSRRQVTWSGVRSWGNCTLSHGAFSLAACIFRAALFSFSACVVLRNGLVTCAILSHSRDTHQWVPHLLPRQMPLVTGNFSVHGEALPSPSPICPHLPLHPAPSSLPRPVNSRQECVRYSVSGAWHLASQRCDSGNGETTQRYEDWLHEYTGMTGRYHSNLASTSL